MSNSYTTVFIDLDDTLLLTQENNQLAMKEVFTEQDWIQYFDSFEHFFGIYAPINHQLWHLYEHEQISKEQLMADRIRKPLAHENRLHISHQQALEIHQTLFDKMGKFHNTVDGVHDILHYLHNKYRLAIISNGFKEVQFIKLKSANILNFFQEIILSDVVGSSKPNTKIFKYALQKTGTLPQQAIMIGDNWNTDILGAKNASIDQIWYNPAQKPFQEFSPTHTVKQLSQIKSIL